ncbi:MAG TPA: ABC transporter substrate-binding protein [Acidimicrobiia bacterium]|nr:ABC transporter substrate-binding protein [Acidimicrobiia bacterium]
MPKLTSRPGLRFAVALTSAVLLTSACGTRAEDTSSSAGATSTTAADAGAAPEVPTDPGTAAGAPADSPASAAPVSPGATGGSAPAAGGSTGTTAPRSGSAAAPKSGSPNKASGSSAASPAPSSGSGASAAPGGSSGGGAKASPAPGAGAAPAPAAPVAPPGDSPIIIASIGILSGPAGGALAPNVQGTQMWVKWINSKGGINGHPVKLYVYDDQGDPAKHRAQAQEAIEKQKAIALVMNNEAIAGRGSFDYINSKKIPVIGNEGASPWYYESPYYFTQAPTGDANFYAAVGAAAPVLAKDHKKYGSIVCVEAPACDQADSVPWEAAGELGFEPVYRARASIAQPDYTAECLAARNAGVQSLLVFLDPAGINRVVTACTRQGFKPKYITANSLVVDAQKDVPQLDGMVASTPVFPWFQGNTPATREYQEVYKIHGKGLAPGVGGPTGWVSAKLFERAAAGMPEPPTSAYLLKNLYSLKNDTLGGLTQPHTFTEGRNAVPKACWFTIVIKDKAWTSPDNYAQHCKQ